MDARSVGRINARGVSEYEARPIERNEFKYLGKPPVRSEPGHGCPRKNRSKQDVSIPLLRGRSDRDFKSFASRYHESVFKY